MRAIAAGLDNAPDDLIPTAMQETNLPEARLRNEKNTYGIPADQLCRCSRKREWLEARIDTANPDRNPPKPDIRKLLLPLGPVVVYGASNFPFAYSTAGG